MVQYQNPSYYTGVKDKTETYERLKSLFEQSLQSQAVSHLADERSSWRYSKWKLLQAEGSGNRKLNKEWAGFFFCKLFLFLGVAGGVCPGRWANIWSGDSWVSDLKFCFCESWSYDSVSVWWCKLSIGNATFSLCLIFDTSSYEHGLLVPCCSCFFSSALLSVHTLHTLHCS